MDTKDTQYLWWPAPMDLDGNHPDKDLSDPLTHLPSGPSLELRLDLYAKLCQVGRPNFISVNVAQRGFCSPQPNEGPPAPASVPSFEQRSQAFYNRMQVRLSSHWVRSSPPRSPVVLGLSHELQNSWQAAQSWRVTKP